MVRAARILLAASIPAAAAMAAVVSQRAADPEERTRPGDVFPRPRPQADPPPPPVIPPTTSPATEPSTNPSAAASTRPATRPLVFPARPMASSFDVLLARSVFAGRGAGAARRGANSQADGAGAAGAAAAAAGGPQATLAFRGVGLSDGQYTAFIEDLAANGAPAGLRRVHSGEAIARGRVVAITLDQLVYEADGRVTPVPIGSTLAGTPLPPPPKAPQPSTAPAQHPAAPAGGPQGQPPPTPPAQGGGAAPANAVIEVDG